MVRRWMCLMFLVSTGLLFAENQQGQNSQQQQGGVRGPARIGSAVQVFDDRVFDSIGVVPTAPPTRTSAAGTTRYLAPEADYNSGQVQQWMQTCAPLKSLDPGSYRDCYVNEKRKSAEDLRRSLAEVEGVQGSQPYYPSNLPSAGPAAEMDQDMEREFGM